jgi:hypothetical protein
MMVRRSSAKGRLYTSPKVLASRAQPCSLLLLIFEPGSRHGVVWRGLLLTSTAVVVFETVASLDTFSRTKGKTCSLVPSLLWQARPRQSSMLCVMLCGSRIFEGGEAKTPKLYSLAIAFREQETASATLPPSHSLWDK